uniref:Importin subunit alpha n=1 Tax=Panagrolaimus davidi TaxID=227884 RepID=A0A914QJW0_9BILA
MGDAEIHPFIDAATTAQQANDGTRLQNSLNFLKNYNVKHILFRRRAVEEIRIVLTSRPNAYEPFKDDIVHVFNKILKMPKEDILVLEQILWTITNLSHANSKLIHELLPTREGTDVQKGIVKVIAHHAKTSTASAVRDQAIMCLGNVVSDCDSCRNHVMETSIFETVLDLLQTPTNFTAKQRDHYAWTLQNILRPSPTSPYLNVLITQVRQEKMFKVVIGLITLPPPDASIIQGVELLHDWIMIDSEKSVGVSIVENETLMNHLLQIFDGDDDDSSSKVIRSIGNLAFNDDDVIQRIIDYGFVSSMHARILTAGVGLESDIIWCLSNILGSLRPSCVHTIYDRTDLLEYLVRNCYSYEFLIRRESIFCVMNICTFFQGEEQTELYQAFFGKMIIDILDGFTIEEDESMAQAVQGILTHCIDEMNRNNPIYKEMIYENGFKAAVQRRYEWTKETLQTFDVGTPQRRELFILFNLCIDALISIIDYKNVLKCDDQMAKMKSDALAPMDSTPRRPPQKDIRERSFAILDDTVLNISPITTK